MPLDLPRVRVLQPHVPDPGTEAVRFASGDVLWIGEESERYPGWVRVRMPDGRKTWAPEAYVRGEPGREGRAAVEYDSTELSVSAGEEVTVLREYRGWAWVRTDDGREGWVPMEVLELEA